MIDLAPNHKLGLVVNNPILLAGGTIGYGEAVAPGLRLDQLGGAVVGPLLLNSRAGSDPPRLAEINGGFVLETGLQNRGLEATLRHFARLWPKLGCPVIVQLADAQPAALARVAERLIEVDGIAGLELLLPRDADAALIRALLRSLMHVCDLPLWVKLPLERAVELALICVQSGAVGLVIGQAPLGMAYPRGRENELTIANGQLPINGSLYGPLVFPTTLATLHVVAQLQLGCALIACGGIHTLDHVRQALAAGALAVQIDSAVWVEPGLPQRLASELQL